MPDEPEAGRTRRTAREAVASNGLGRPVSYVLMVCAQCASPVPEGSQFCTYCGADVIDSPSGPGAALDDAGVAKLTRMLRQETAGEYEIEREIGRGGMGVVYLASEIQLRRRVAIKVLPPALTFGERTIERFRREARMAAALDHPNIIPIHRVSAGGELLWYSMKLLEGRSLDTILREKDRLPFEETVAIVDQVADALDYAHRHGVIHRDIKPGNIVLDERGRVTVTDFGIAKELQDGSVTASGAVLGTPSYMSPEQCLGTEVRGATDQYSLGVVAYQCLAGRVPFDATSTYELLSKHGSKTPPALSELRSDLPPSTYAAIERALAKAPAHRFPTATDFANALAGRTPIVIPPAPRAARRRRLMWWGAGLAAAAVTLYTGGKGLPHGAEAPQPVPQPSQGETAITTPAGPAPDAAAQSGPAQRTATTVPARRPAPVQAPMAVLIVQMTGGWARIYVNGEFRGERPVHREELPPGTHTLRFERPEFLAVDTTLTLRAGQNLIAVQMRRAIP